MRFVLLRRLRALLASAQLRHLDEDATLDALLEAGFRPEQSFWQSVVDPHFGLPPAATAGVVAAAIAAANTKSIPKALMGSCLSSTASSTAELRTQSPPTSCCSIS
jgi:2-methylcitrate dehydratase PrpD